MQLDDLSAYLSSRLREPLPGLKASQLMSARLANGNRIKLRHEKPAKQGSVMILLYQDGDTVRFPLIQRPEYPGVHSGQMALPGGKKEPDEDDIQAALRETQEEIGIHAGEIEVIGSLSSFYVFASNFQILPVIGRIRRKPMFIPQEEEVAEIVAADIYHLMNDEYHKEKDITVGEGFELRAPYFDLEGKVVWGATAMMLNEFKMILKDFE
jgi:8-oxo-dGTP pyrophosphatase MutT (NUDIX family)